MKNDEMWSLFEYNSLEDQQLTINQRKQANDFFKVGRNLAKKEKCFHCEKDVTSFCNSHSVPAFTLKNTSKDGFLLTLNQFLSIPFLPKQTGLNKTGTFQLICNECDSKIFSDYENPEKYDCGQPSQKMLAQIAMKNYLHAISKKHIENEWYKVFGGDKGYADEALLTKELDLNEYIKGYTQARKILEKGWNDYYLFYHKVLDYTVPIAFQDEINVIADFNNKIINDIYNLDPNYHTSGIHVCVFPLKKKSAIIMFVHKNHSARYKSFYKSFRKKDLNDQLQIINYLIIAYSENFFLSPYLPKEALDDHELKAVAMQSTETVIETSDILNSNPMELILEYYNYSKARSIPNLLLLDVDSFKQ